MTEADEIDMANTAIMLNDAVEKRLSSALLNTLRGMPSKYGWSSDDDPMNSYNPAVAQMHIEIALMNLLKPSLQTLIRQEIMNAFSQSNGCTKLVKTGDTIGLDFNMNLR